jgi:hypothetical protein
MEAMRQRFFAAVASLGLLSAMVGCYHTAGCCDCDQEGYGCCCTGYGDHNGYGHGDVHVISSVPIAAPAAPPIAPLPTVKPADADKPAEKTPAPKPEDATIKEKE